MPPRTGNAHYSIAPFETFACAAGGIVICAANGDLFARLCAVIGLPDPAVAPHLRANSGRLKVRAKPKTEIESALRRRGCGLAQDTPGDGTAQWAINEVAQAIGSPQTSARRMVIEVGGLLLPR
ncbi:CoA transferase [Parafrankia sp. FMc2]|uniref:CoA transferase n=1 Tax=Parafrankia sp. FMc2 TaxID=3233196 RepID=UPI0034D5A69E